MKTPFVHYPKYIITKTEQPVVRSLPTELSHSELHELTECALYAARSAAEVLNDIYLSSADIGVELKDDQTPVTKADKAADARIIEVLKKHTRFPVITEEQPLDFSDRRDRKSVWLVDPLDGTQNFINRDGQFAVLIALLHFNAPVIGVIAVPETGECYTAFHQGGAVVRPPQGPAVPIRHPHQDRALRAVLSSMPSDEGRQREEEFCQVNGITAEQIFRIGSAFKLARLARGEFDCTARFDVLSEWDTAAADCLLAEAGCQMKDVISNTSIAYNSQKSFSLPGYLVLRSDYDFVEQIG